MSGPLRALHVLRPDHETRFGGDVVHLRNLVAGLRDAGVDAEATTWDEAAGAVDIVHLWNLDLPWALRRHLDEARARFPDARVVLTPIFSTWSPMSLARSRDPAVVHRAARNAAKAWSTWRLVRAALRDVDAVVACSHRELAMLEGYYRVRRGPAWNVAPTAVWMRDWPVRSRSAAREALATTAGWMTAPRTVVACAGRLEPLKNQATLVRAVASLPGVALVLVGAGTDESYRRTVLGLGERLLSGRFAWLGRQPAAGVADVLAAADVHALPSHREVASISSLEAAAAGCGVVAGRWSSASEYFGDLVHLCDAHAPASVAAAIQAARDAPHQPELRDVVAARHDWSAVAPIVAAAYRELVTARR